MYIYICMYAYTYGIHGDPCWVLGRFQGVRGKEPKCTENKEGSLGAWVRFRFWKCSLQVRGFMYFVCE